MEKSENVSQPNGVDQCEQETEDRRDLYISKNELFAVIFIMFFYIGPFIMLYLVYYIIFYTQLYPILIIYGIWAYTDRETPFRDGRSSTWLRSMPLWKHYRNYFPQKFVKTGDLPPDHNYIMCLFPHGIICSAAFAHFSSMSSDFHKKNPGLTVTGHTLDSNFRVPILRDYLMALGLVSVSKETLMYKLRNPNGGHAATLVIGGSAEAMKSKPGTYRIVLKNRKGFVKLALLSGASLVPVFIFGETNIYSHWIPPEGSFLYRLQEGFRKYTGVAPCMINGRGVFQKYFGILPHRTPVTTVAGNPIHVKKTENPTKEEINELHKRFTDEISQLFEEHKHKYVKNPEETFLSIED